MIISKLKARIVEDLKRTEEVAEKRQQAKIVQQQNQTFKRQQKQPNLQFRQHFDNGMIVSSETVANADSATGMFQQHSIIQKKAVELAEAVILIFYRIFCKSFRTLLFRLLLNLMILLL